MVSARALPVTERGRRARASIIDAAATLMYQKGVSMTSLDDVLAAAGRGRVLTDVFTYTIADGAGATDSAQLRIGLDIAAPYIAPPSDGNYFDLYGLDANSRPPLPDEAPR